MPPLPAHIPSLSRGMKIYLNDLITYAVSGVNAAESRTNLLNWLDALIYRVSPQSLLQDLENMPFITI